MAQPPTYNRATSFTNFQSLNPTTPLPASSVDQELNRIKTTLDAVLANLELIQRDDGDLANESVGFDQLADEVSTGMFNRPTVWETATDYTADDDAVFHDSAFYRCLVTHTSGVFATDLSAGKWELILDLSDIEVVDADQIAVTPAGGIASTNVQDALEELDAEKAASSHSHPATGISDSTTIGRTILTAADAAAVLTALGISGAAPNYGDIKATAAISVPSFWLLCAGQAISRTTYADLFAAITITQSGSRTNSSPVITGLSDTSSMRAGMPVSGTGIPSSTTILTVDSGTQITLSGNATSTGTNDIVVAPHGVGDGSTTFNVPDIKGRTIAGRDDMNGSAASRLTSSTIVGTRLGNAGGSQTHTLTTAQIPVITPTGTVAITDNGHSHLVAKNKSDSDALSADDPICSQANFGADQTYDLRCADGDTADVGKSSTTTTGVTAAFTGDAFGSGSAHANVQPTIVENFIIFAGV